VVALRLRLRLVAGLEPLLLRVAAVLPVVVFFAADVFRAADVFLAAVGFLAAVVFFAAGVFRLGLVPERFVLLREVFAAISNSPLSRASR